MLQPTRPIEAVQCWAGKPNRRENVGDSSGFAARTVRSAAGQADSQCGPYVNSMGLAGVPKNSRTDLPLEAEVFSGGRATRVQSPAMRRDFRSFRFGG